MRDKLRRLAHRGLEISGLIGPLHRRVERRIARESEALFDDGLPMPPADLRVVVAGTADAAWFSTRGKTDADQFLALAATHGQDVERGLDVWDLGCGCGRIARWVSAAVHAHGGTFQGSDINRRLVDWCAGHLMGRYVVNRLQPPASMASRSLDLVYAYSVVTHLREKATRRWLAEIARVLRPGGLALISFHDEAAAEGWGPPTLPAGLAGQDYLVLNDALEGSNYMSAWTTRGYFSRMATAHFEVLDVLPGRRDPQMQALAVLRARA